MRPSRFVVCLLVIACAAPVSAQAPCPPGDVNQHQGAWRARPFPRSAATFKAAAGSYNRAVASGTLDTILGLLRAAYPQPAGTNAYFDRDLTFSTPSRGVPFGYALSVAFGGFQCTPAGKLAELGESGVFINVDVNSVGSAGLVTTVAAREINTLKGTVTLNAASDEDSQYTIGGKRAFLIPATAGEHRGVDYYAKNEYSRTGDPPDWQWFVVRKPGVPLLIPVTRREYVQQFRSELATFNAREFEVLRDSARQSGETNMPPQLAAFERSQAAYLRAVDDYLKNAGERELARPVSEHLMFMPRDPDNPSVQCRDGDRVMAFLNPAYMDPARPAHVPQFIVIQLSARAARYPWEKDLRDRISAGLDVDALRGLLGK
jgi:hypothetical protein